MRMGICCKLVAPVQLFSVSVAANTLNTQTAPRLSMFYWFQSTCINSICVAGVLQALTWICQGTSWPTPLMMTSWSIDQANYSTSHTSHTTQEFWLTICTEFRQWTKKICWKVSWAALSGHGTRPTAITGCLLLPACALLCLIYAYSKGSVHAAFSPHSQSCLVSSVYVNDGSVCTAAAWLFDKRQYMKKAPPRNLQPPPPRAKHEMVRKLIAAINTATENIPCWDEYVKTGKVPTTCDEIIPGTVYPTVPPSRNPGGKQRPSA